MKLIDSCSDNGKIVFMLKSGAFVTLTDCELEEAKAAIAKAEECRSSGEHFVVKLKRQ